MRKVRREEDGVKWEEAIITGGNEANEGGNTLPGGEIDGAGGFFFE
jgi:hypothetical protein